MKWKLTISHLLGIAFSVSMNQILIGQTMDSTILLVNKTADFEVTGRGTSANWAGTSWLTLPQRKSAGGISYQTRLKILYSDSGIYCLYYCEDKKITATLREDFADLYNEDVVEAFFWPDESVAIYFEYELSPLNHELPILVPNNKGDFLGWRPWHYEGNRLTRHGAYIEKDGDAVKSWTAEFFIPYHLLKPLANVPPQKGTRWRANFYRIDYDEKTSAWSWQLTRKNFHDFERFGTLVFN